MEKSTNTTPDTMYANTGRPRSGSDTGSNHLWNIHICPATGGGFEINLPADESIEGLKSKVAKKLKLSKDRINLLYKDRVLKEGTIRENGVYEGCRLALLPNVESGLMSQKPDNTVMSALESLSDSQVNDFLSGKSPLTLAMRLGDHMMFVQLQLSTSGPNIAARNGLSIPATSNRNSSHSPQPHSTVRQNLDLRSHRSSGAIPTQTVLPSAANYPLGSSNMMTPPSSPSTLSPQLPTKPMMSHAQHKMMTLQKRNTAPAPILRSRLTRDQSEGDQNNPRTIPATSTSNIQPEKRLFHQRTPFMPHNSLNRTDNCPKQTSQTNHASISNLLDSSALAVASRNLSQRLKEFSIVSSNHLKEKHQVPPSPPPSPYPSPPTSPTTKSSSPKKCSSRHRNDKGAMIETMYHHGEGVYSGTFSGTLNPALQDGRGKPKKSIGTIIHILNDLLGASPQYRLHMAGNHHPNGSKIHHHSTHQHHHHQHHAMRPHTPSSPPPPRFAKEHTTQNVKIQENMATRGKMEQIQMMLKERRQRRRARREARTSPYSIWHPAKNQSTNQNIQSSSEGQEMEVDANVEASNVPENVQDNANYTQLTQETVVA